MPPRSPSPLPTILSFTIIAAALLIGIVLLLVTRPEPVHITINPPAPTAAPLPTATPAPIVVEVGGAVNQPGLVTLPAGSRIADAIEAAGGFTADADTDRINRAQILHDGEQLYVYRQGESAVVPPENSLQPTPNGTAGEHPIVHVNHATLEELETLPGIGPVKAQAIIDYRTANGPFTSLESMTAVPGIGEATVQQLDGWVVFD